MTPKIHHVEHALVGKQRLLLPLYSCRAPHAARSATTANPSQHACRLLGVDTITLITQDGSPSGPKQFVLWNPPLSHHSGGAHGSADKQPHASNKKRRRGAQVGVNAGEVVDAEGALDLQPATKQRSGKLGAARGRLPLPRKYARVGNDATIAAVAAGAVRPGGKDAIVSESASSGSERGSGNEDDDDAATAAQQEDATLTNSAAAVPWGLLSRNELRSRSRALSKAERVLARRALKEANAARHRGTTPAHGLQEWAADAGARVLLVAKPYMPCSETPAIHVCNLIYML
jgi:hypothetical protein